MSLDHLGETLFSLLVYLGKIVVDGTKDIGQALLGRTGRLAERLNDVAKEIRTSHARNALLPASASLKLTSVTGFNEGVRKWKEEVT